MKKYSNSIVAKILLVLIAISFVVVGGISGSISTRSNVATVKKENISFADFYRSYTYQARQMGLDPLLLRQTRYADIVLDGMIRDLTTFVTAKDLGVVATSVEITQQLQDTPAFQLNGTFDQQQFTAVLQSGGLDSDSYIDGLTKSATTDKYLNAFKVFGLTMPTAVDILYKNSKQSRTLIRAKKSFADVPDPTYTDTDLNMYYQQNQQTFEVPETRNITVLYLTNTAVANSISDMDAKQYFTDNPKIFDSPETRSFYTIGGSKDTLQTVLNALNSGTDLTTAVQDILGQDVATLITENASKNSLDHTLKEAVFSTDAGAYSNIIVGPFSNMIVFVENITPAYIATFDDTIDEIKQTMAFDFVFDVILNIENAVANSKSLQQIAKDINISPITLDITKNGTNTQPFATNQEFINNVFEMKQGNISDIQDLGDDTFIISHLNTIKKTHVPALTDIKNDVINSYIQRKKMDILNGQLATLTAITDPIIFNTESEKLGFKVQTISEQEVSELMDTSIAKAFNIKVGSAISDIKNNTAQAIFAVSRTLPTEVPSDEQQRFNNIVKDTSSNILEYAVQNAFVLQTPAKINRQLIDSVYNVGGIGQ